MAATDSQSLELKQNPPKKNPNLQEKKNPCGDFNQEMV